MKSFVKALKLTSFFTLTLTCIDKKMSLTFSFTKFATKKLSTVKSPKVFHASSETNFIINFFARPFLRPQLPAITENLLLQKLFKRRVVLS